MVLRQDQFGHHLFHRALMRKKVSQFGSNVPMQRPGQPYELAPAYVYLASDDSSYVTGQMIHVNGGVIVNG